jgi:two-component system sensor histidine kinase MtrB
VKLSLRTRIAATVAVAVLGSTIAVTYAAYELERRGTENRFVAAARTGASSDLQQAAHALEREPTDGIKAVAKFVEQRSGIRWAVVDPARLQSVGSVDLGQIPPDLIGTDYSPAAHWVDLDGRVRHLALGGTVGDSGISLIEFYNFGPVEQQLARLRSDLIRLDALGLVVALSLGLLVASGISRPVRAVAAAARRLGGGALDTRVPVRGKDELAEMGGAFNEMAERLAAAMGALQSAQEQQRRFVSDVSHELRTPLAATVAAADGLESADPCVRRRSAELVGAQLRRMNALVEDLLEISRFDAGQARLEIEPVALDALAADAVRTVAPGEDIRIVTLGDPEVQCDARRVHTVLRNLVGNAVQHGAPPVHVHVDGRGPAVRVTVADSGPGVDPEVAATLFDRFVRGDAARSGSGSSTGLGLAIALENARLHGASLGLLPGNAAAFVLSLPRLPSP